MSKYDTGIYAPSDFNIITTPGEKIFWTGKPQKKAFIINKCLAMLPIAVVWLCFDMFFIGSFFSSIPDGRMTLFIIPFFAFHLAPVWIWLSNVLTAKKRWENTQYAVTDKRIIVQSGFIGMECKSIYYKDIRNVRLNIGAVDKMLGVGDIYFDTPDIVVTQKNTSRTGSASAFLDIPDAVEIYPKIQKIIMDIQTDIEYPNDYRPKTNPGYNTDYDGKI